MENYMYPLIMIALIISIAIALFTTIFSLDIKAKFLSGVITLCLMVTIGIVANSEGVSRKLETQKIEDAWIAEGCPVFAAECGSKSKYACEIKSHFGAGRLQYGEVFVTAYKTCEKK